MKRQLLVFALFFVCFNYSLMMHHARFQAFTQLAGQETSWPSFPTAHPLQQFLYHFMCVFWLPLMHLYLYGPKLPFLGGFWKGSSMKEMCYLLTNDMSYATVNLSRCEELLFNGFESFYTIVHFCMFAILLLVSYNYFYTTWFYTRLVDQTLGKFSFGRFSPTKSKSLT